MIVLTGCTTPTPAPTTASPPPSSPTPTAEPAAIPAPRTPIGCEAAFDAATLDAVLHSSATLETVDPSYEGPSSAAVVQQGGLRCNWSAASSSLAVLITPLDIWSSPPATRARSCQESQCRAAESAGDFFIEAHPGVYADPLSPSLGADFDALIGQLATAVSVGIGPVWVSPEQGTAAPDSCGGLDDPGLAAALGSPDGGQIADSGDGFAGGYEAMARAGYGECLWSTGDTTFGVTYTPGGAWALPRPGDPIEVAGAVAATVVCDGGCRIDARVGATWVQLWFDEPSQTRDAASTRLSSVIPYLPIVSSAA